MSIEDNDKQLPQHSGFEIFADGHAAKDALREPIEEIEDGIAEGISIGMVPTLGAHGREVGWNHLLHVTPEQQAAIETAFPDEPLPQMRIIGDIAMQDTDPELDDGDV